MKRLKIVPLIVLLILIFSGCMDTGKEINPKLKDIKTKSNFNFTKSENRDIFLINRGTVDKYADIDFLFTYDQVGTEDIGYKMKNNEVFSFEPKCEGYMVWRTKKKLSFVPKYGFESKTRYNGIVNLEKLFDDEALKDKKYEFVYQVKGIEVLNLEGNFVKDKNFNKFKAYIKLSQNIDNKALKKSISIMSKENSYDFKLKKITSTEFSIESGKIESDKEIKFLIKGDSFNQFYKKSYSLIDENEFKVLNIEEIKVGDKSNVQINFSKLIGDNIDYAGYINVEPNLEFTLTKKGRSLILSADFARGMTYKISVMNGLKSAWNDLLEKASENSVAIDISDINPKLEFVNTGVFLSSYKDKKILFRTMNVKRVAMKIKKIEDSKTINFIKDKGFEVRNNYYSKSKYSKYGFANYGEVVDKKIVEIGDQKNRWINSEIDISLALNGKESGVYVIQLEFDEDDSLYFPKDWSEWKISDYTYDNGNKIKHIILSDIGITYKKDRDKGHIFINDIMSSDIISDADIILYKKDGTVIEEIKTDKNGMAETDKDFQYIEARLGDEFSILSVSNSRLSRSLFDTSGEQNEGVKAFIYTERGVYRPGDQLNITVIARNEKKEFPDDYPVKMKLYNPRGKLIKTISSKGFGGGFYSYNIKTDEKDLTGDWNAEFAVGDKVFNKTIKIEEIVPYKIRVKLDSEKDNISKDETINFDLKSEYLFGAAAEYLKLNYEISIDSYEKKFEKYKDFVFDANVLLKFSYKEDFESNLDEKGEYKITYKLPELKDLPSDLRIKVKADVMEKSGRKVPAVKFVKVKTYKNFVGIRKLKKDQVATGENANFEITLLNENGKNVAGKEIEYKIYRMDRYWWWHYSSDEDFKKQFKSDERTKLISEGKLLSNEKLTKLKYPLNEYGEFLIELKDLEGGHKIAYFFRSYWWGDAGKKKDADILTLKTDKKVYLDGEMAKIIAKTPEQGKALLTIEKSGKIIEKKWYDLKNENTEFILEMKKEYAPNIYVSVTVFQKYKNSVENDIPVRTYGFIPIFVEKKGTRLSYEIEMPESIEPKAEFSINISTKEKVKSKLTVAVVDQGLLDITKYKTPSPWNYFYGKEKMITETYDSFGDLISNIPAYVHRKFSLGGGYELADENVKEKTERSVKKKRFKAVSFYQKPIETDNEGNAKITFKMSEYIGAVKVMVVGADKDSYGSVEKEVKVKTDLIANLDLPRFLGLGDTVKVPVSLYALKDGIGEIKVSISSNGLVDVKNDKEIIVNMKKEGTKDLYFEIETKDAIGKAEIKLEVSSSEKTFETVKYIDIKPYKNYIYKSENKVLEKGQNVEIVIPSEQVKGSGAAFVKISKRKNIDLDKRLKYLIRYPYGCIEQTVSSVFPQIYLPVIFDINGERKIEMDKNINAAIERLQKFQLKNGSFSYWPSGNSSSEWGTNYAGHFLAEAKKKGYYVPEDMYSKYLKYQIDKSKNYKSDYINTTYRFYVLALAGKEQLSPMNYYKESIDSMETVEKLLLAGAYKYAGYDSVADNIVKNLKSYKAYSYPYNSSSYGSKIRDRAIMLELLSYMGKKEEAVKIYEEIMLKLEGKRWYSTQSTAYSLLAVAKYLETLGDRDGKIDFEMSDKKYSYFGKVFEKDISAKMGESIVIKNISNDKLYIIVNWEGIPLEKEEKIISSKIKLSRKYLNENGEEIDIKEVKQGDSFWIHYRVKKLEDSEVNELVLNQILPAGWEIENSRINRESVPNFTRNLELNKEEYTDIRDDRIAWFFDMGWYDYNYDFLVKVNAVSIGEYYLAPAIAQGMYERMWYSSTGGIGVKVLGENN